MKRTVVALAVSACVLAVASCVEVTSGRRDGTSATAPAPGRVTGEKSKVHVYAWNPLDGVYDVVSFPVKAVGKGIKKIF